jgi:hypothetical protein
MIYKLVHRVDPFHEGRTPRHDHTLSALRYGRRLVYETTEVVAADFGLQLAKQT